MIRSDIGTTTDKVNRTKHLHTQNGSRPRFPCPRAHADLSYSPFAGAPLREGPPLHLPGKVLTRRLPPVCYRSSGSGATEAESGWTLTPSRTAR
jgi:hypothetical protein